MKITDYCSRCKTKGKPLIKYNFSNNTQYHYCRDCQNARTKKWGSTAKGKLWLQARNKRYYKRYLIQRKAREALNNAIMLGKINKPKKCSVCYKIGRIEGHHPNYAIPLEVMWLCTSCHAIADKIIS